MPARVIQAYFPGGRPPAHLVTRTYPSSYGSRVVAPHPATVQRKAAPHAATLPASARPHPATLPAAPAAQPKPASAKPPHPATVQRRPAPVTQPAARAPHPATKAPHPAQRQVATSSLAPGEVHAFRTPDGFLDQSQGRGTSELPALVRRKMETFFEADFSDVRVHVGPEAAAIGAVAFTIGSDIYFAPGQFEPESPRGQELLGHELTHVVQQREGRVDNPFSSGVAVVQDSGLEDEADRMGRLVASQTRAVPTYRRERQRAPSPPGEPEAPEPPARARPAHAAQRKTDYRLVVGAYLHDDKALPEPLAGHAFVALEGPDGNREAWGFSPAHYGSYDPQRDLGTLTQGVEGVVHDDLGSLAKPGVKTKAYSISAAQAQAARAKVEEYQSGKYRFNLKDRQCSAFAVDVLDAAKIDDLDGVRAQPPRALYRKL